MFVFTPLVQARENFFKVQSIDTMKFSRDTARSQLNSQTFDSDIEIQIKNIADTGATHVAIDTPYDNEFVPFLTRWVTVARKYHLLVWFRGNWSGWENWFDYPKIGRETHLENTKEFILTHPDLFEDGDVFTACPECENGGPGDPRQTHDVGGFRNFMINEYQMTKDAFNQIHKNIYSNFDSMNADVARLIMDKNTIKALDNVVAIDHYVKSPDDYIKIKSFFPPGTKIVMGEFGAPIPDLQGDMSESDQAQWIGSTLHNIIQLNQVIAVNYWTNKGSSTALWKDNNEPNKAVQTINDYYVPTNISGVVKDNEGKVLQNVIVDGKEFRTKTVNGLYVLPVFENESVYFHKPGYVSVSIVIIEKNTKDVNRDIILYPEHQFFITNIVERFINWLKYEINKPN